MLINPPESIDNLGGKGYQLTLLSRICAVPKFFVIRFDSNTEIDDIGVQNEIFDVLDSHKFSLVSVRSSATVEDSRLASFAGLFKSKLNIKRRELINAIQEVLSSLDDDHVDAYCRLINQQSESIKMRIIVQKMVHSRISGVCLTKDKPGSQTMLIEACLGLGESLVSGMITPDTYMVDRTTLEVVSSNIGLQEFITFSGDSENLRLVSNHYRNEKKLSDIEISEISRHCLFLESELGYEAANFEWTYEDNLLYILQSRPFVGSSRH